MKNQSNESTSTYQSVKKAISECNDLRTLKFALLDTLDNMNATNTNELFNDLITCYGLGKLKDIK